MKRTSLVLLFFFITACGTSFFQPETTLQAPEKTLRIFAAVSLSDAFYELASRFEVLHPDVTISLNFASSNTLRAQIEQGAQADLFASASSAETEQLAAQGLIDASQPFAENRLVLITPAKNARTLSHFTDLTRPELKVVLASEDVPAGYYSRVLLGNLGEDFKTKTLKNLVSNENSVRQVLTKVQLGEADAGIVYASDLFAAENINAIEFPAEAKVSIFYPIASLIDAPHPETAKTFVDFLLSAEGQEILANWGFLPVNEQKQ